MQWSNEFPEKSSRIYINVLNHIIKYIIRVIWLLLAEVTVVFVLKWWMAYRKLYFNFRRYYNYYTSQILLARFKKYLIITFNTSPPPPGTSRTFVYFRYLLATTSWRIAGVCRSTRVPTYYLGSIEQNIISNGNRISLNIGSYFYVQIHEIFFTNILNAIC